MAALFDSFWPTKDGKPLVRKDGKVNRDYTDKIYLTGMLVNYGGNNYREATNTLCSRETNCFGDHAVTSMEVTSPLPNESDVEHVGAVGRSAVQGKKRP